MDKQTPQIHPWKVLLYTCAAVFTVTLDATILFVAFPAIRASYPQISPANLSWILNAYTIVVGAMLIPAGAYADKFGRKKIFLIGVPVFTAGSLLCGISQGVWFLIAARALQGLGAAFLPYPSSWENFKRKNEPLPLPFGVQSQLLPPP